MSKTITIGDEAYERAQFLSAKIGKAVTDESVAQYIERLIGWEEAESEQGERLFDEFVDLRRPGETYTRGDIARALGPWDGDGYRDECAHRTDLAITHGLGLRSPSSTRLVEVERGLYRLVMP